VTAGQFEHTYQVLRGEESELGKMSSEHFTVIVRWRMSKPLVRCNMKAVSGNRTATIAEMPSICIDQVRFLDTSPASSPACS
jgi:hypothetical protein